MTNWSDFIHRLSLFPKLFSKMYSKLENKKILNSKRAFEVKRKIFTSALFSGLPLDLENLEKALNFEMDPENLEN